MIKKYRYPPIIIFVLWFALADAQKFDWQSTYGLKEISSGQHKLLDNDSGRIAVILFFSPECPICKAYAPFLTTLSDTFAARGVTFNLVYPGDVFSKIALRRFHHKYGVQLRAYVDRQKRLAAVLAATTTPQAFLMDAAGEILYKGKPDNLYESVGNRRSIVTEHYLLDAVNAFLAGHEIQVKETDPVGCLIN